MGLCVHGGQVGACVITVFGYALLKGVQTVVLELAVQFVKQFHADDFTVRSFRAQ